jgi:hypothetical protein
LPPGVPFEHQQFAALSGDTRLIVDDSQMADLATRIRAACA